MPPTKRKRGRALENVGTKELMAALDIEAGIISEASLRIGQQLHKLQFEEKLLREMLQRSEGAHNSAAVDFDASSAMTPAPPPKSSRPATSAAAGPAPHPEAAASVVSETEAVQQSISTSEAVPVAVGHSPTAAAAASLPPSDRNNSSRAVGGPMIRPKAKSAASNAQNSHKEVGTMQRSAQAQTVSPASGHAAIRRRDNLKTDNVSTKETSTKSPSDTSSDAGPDFDTVLAGLTGLPALE